MKLIFNDTKGNKLNEYLNPAVYPREGDFVSFFTHNNEIITDFNIITAEIIHVELDYVNNHYIATIKIKS